MCACEPSFTCRRCRADDRYLEKPDTTDDDRRAWYEAQRGPVATQEGLGDGRAA